MTEEDWSAASLPPVVRLGRTMEDKCEAEGVATQGIRYQRGLTAAEP